MDEENNNESTENQNSDDSTESTEGEQSSTEDTPSGDAGKNADTDNGEQSSSESDTNSADAYADIKAPEGMELDQAVLNDAVSVFQKHGIPKEAAQELTNLYAKNVQDSVQKQVESFNQLKQDWLTQAKSDKDIGGDKFDETVATAKEALSKFGTPELTELLNEFGVGNHPEVIRVFARVGALTKEDNPGGSSGAPSGKKDRVSVLYPNS